MKQAYGYIVKHGCCEDNLTHLCQFIIFADEVDVADNWIERDVKKQIEDEKHEIDDDGTIDNWWWKYYSVEKVPVSKFNDDCANIVWLEGE